jgi:hypothetical protein
MPILKLVNTIKCKEDKKTSFWTIFAIKLPSAKRSIKSLRSVKRQKQ